MLRKNFLFTQRGEKDTFEDFGVGKEKKFYAYWRAGEKSIKSHETLTIFPKVSQDLCFWKNGSHSDELYKVVLV